MQVLREFLELGETFITAGCSSDKNTYIFNFSVPNNMDVNEHPKDVPDLKDSIWFNCNCRRCDDCDHNYRDNYCNEITYSNGRVFMRHKLTKQIREVMPKQCRLIIMYNDAFKEVFAYLRTRKNIENIKMTDEEAMDAVIHLHGNREIYRYFSMFSHSVCKHGDITKVVSHPLPSFYERNRFMC